MVYEAAETFEVTLKDLSLCWLSKHDKQGDFCTYLERFKCAFSER